jgi:hypothetical protein
MKPEINKQWLSSRRGWRRFLAAAVAAALAPGGGNDDPAHPVT